MNYCKLKTCAKKADPMSSAQLCEYHAKKKAELQKDPNGLILKVLELMDLVERHEEDIKELLEGEK